MGSDGVPLPASKLARLKELRPRQTNIRVLFVLDPWRSAILLIAGDKAGQLELIADIGGHLLKMPANPAA